jgi:hypothetical protein
MKAVASLAVAASGRHWPAQQCLALVSPAVVSIAQRSNGQWLPAVSGQAYVRGSVVWVGAPPRNQVLCVGQIDRPWALWAGSSSEVLTGRPVPVVTWLRMHACVCVDLTLDRVRAPSLEREYHVCDHVPVHACMRFGHWKPTRV